MDSQNHRRKLIRILQLAYSGELAAAYAYRGHWKSVKKPEERKKIRDIENDEWVHRQSVKEMLLELKGKPLKRKEIKMWIVGRFVGFSCHLIGWFLPMYFAGKLESQNVGEYKVAAFHARNLGMKDYEEELLTMERVEKEHEEFFWEKASQHRFFKKLQRLIPWKKVEVTTNPLPSSSHPSLLSQ